MFAKRYILRIAVLAQQSTNIISTKNFATRYIVVKCQPCHYTTFLVRQACLFRSLYLHWCQKLSMKPTRESLFSLENLMRVVQDQSGQKTPAHCVTRPSKVVSALCIQKTSYVQQLSTHCGKMSVVVIWGSITLLVWNDWSSKPQTLNPQTSFSTTNRKI